MTTTEADLKESEATDEQGTGRGAEELHKIATVLLGAYGRCAAYTLDDLHLSREEREWVDRVLAETREP